MNFDNVFLRRLKDDINDYILLEKWYQEKLESRPRKRWDFGR